MLELLTKSLNVAYGGYTASVAGSGGHSVVEVEAPATRDLFITSVVIVSGVSAFLEKGSSSFVRAGRVASPPDSRTNFSSKLLVLGSGAAGSSSMVPHLNGLIIPSAVTAPSVEVLPVPLIVPAGEFIALISESTNESVRYGFRWLEVVAS